MFSSQTCALSIVKPCGPLVVIPNNLSLKAAKTEIGFDSIVNGGYQLGSGRHSLALKHVAPILDMEPPTDIHELRRVLGLFVQSKSMVANYATVVRPLTRLTGKVPWAWGEKENEAFLSMKEAIAQRPELHNPDYSTSNHVMPPYTRSTLTSPAISAHRLGTHAATTQTLSVHSTSVPVMAISETLTRPTSDIDTFL